MGKSENVRDSEVVANFFGINPKTYEIEQVSLTRGGMLSRAGDGENRWSARIPVADAKHEISARLGLVEIVEARGQNSGEERRKVIEDLEIKAEIMKQENSE